ncbi:hypothetical protein LOAG_15506, partial [Loa loa]
KNETIAAKAESSISMNLVEKVNHPPDVFEMFTLTGYPDTEYAQQRNLFKMTTKNQNMPRRARNNDTVLSGI